ALAKIERDFKRHVDNAVIVEEIVARKSPNGQLHNIGPHQLGGARVQFGERFLDDRLAVVVEQGVEAANPEIERVELTVEVAIKTSRLARIRLQDGDDVVPQHAPDAQLHRRDVHPLLETL